jgi:hypothetical protein
MNLSRVKTLECEACYAPSDVWTVFLSLSFKSFLMALLRRYGKVSSLHNSRTT